MKWCCHVEDVNDCNIVEDVVDMIIWCWVIVVDVFDINFVIMLI